VRFATILLAITLAVAQNKTLYERIGRYDAISAIAEDYLKGLRADPQFTRFTGRSADSLKRAKQLLKDQLCAMAGGPCAYVGRDMETAHGGLAITDAEWAANMKYMSAAFFKKHTAATEKEEFLALIESQKKHIAHQK